MHQFIGQTVNINYNPEDPSEFYVGKGGMKSQMMVGAAFLVVGIILVCTSF